MSKKKLLGLLTGLLTLGGASPALAYGEWFSGGFVTPNPLNCTYDSVTMSTNYLNSYVKPAAGSQWNGVSSTVQMVFVTSGSYRDNVDGDDTREDAVFDDPTFKAIKKAVKDRFKE